MPWKAATIGGPLVPVEVDSAPDRRPTPTSTGTLPGTFTRRHTIRVQPRTPMPMSAVRTRSDVAP